MLIRIYLAWPPQTRLCRNLMLMRVRDPVVVPRNRKKPATNTSPGCELGWGEKRGIRAEYRMMKSGLETTP